MSTTTTSTPPGPSTTRTKWPVVLAVGAVTAVVALWALLAPERSEEVLGSVVGWTSEWFGWFYILLATVILVFVVYVGLRYGKVRLGRDDDRPEFSTFAWASMLFAAGIGTDVMFFAVAEPASQYLAPPQGEGGTLEAARESTVWTLFHYGITGWGMYALMGIALGFFAHRKGLPLAVRSALSPILGRRTKGAAGAAVDIATMLGTIFGIATSLGIGVVMLNVGLDILFGIPQGVPAQIGLVVLAVGVATVSAVTGVDRGIRVLSQLNVLLALLLAAWVLVTRDTAFLLRAAVMNVGDFVSLFPGMTMDTMAFDYDAEWMGGWTLFFWAWWIAWASFVGMFLARISRGRTVREFIIGVVLIPSTLSVLWFSIFGGFALYLEDAGRSIFGDGSLEPQLFNLLRELPLAPVLMVVAMVLIAVFFITSADSASIVMGGMAQHGVEEPSRWIVMLMGTFTAAVAIIMLLAGDGGGNALSSLQNMTIIAASPFVLVLIALCVSIHKSLSHDPAAENA